ncbi:MAG: NfeD family protein [Candidatus Methanomethylophilaceae archaeon]|jgi:membrane protein implicated in regulation of membrane protease activity|nr:NfeD family protein [Candidatus Methanomethylophilaceae archaeon]
MDPTTIALIAVIAGAIFLGIEALIPGAYMIVPGIVLIIVGIIGYIWPEYVLTIYYPVIALVVAVPTTLLTIKGYMVLAKPVPPTTTISESLIGRKGVVTVRTEPGSIRGKVRVDTDTWSATSESEIEVGASVLVEGAEGVHVKVRRI